MTKKTHAVVVVVVREAAIRLINANTNVERDVIDDAGFAAAVVVAEVDEDTVDRDVENAGVAVGELAWMTTDVGRDTSGDHVVVDVDERIDCPDVG